MLKIWAGTAVLSNTSERAGGHNFVLRDRWGVKLLISLPSVDIEEHSYLGASYLPPVDTFSNVFRFIITAW